MSEYQYIEFRAVDRPLTDKELAYASKQSSRAEISRWSFANEYHFGDFRGNADGMLMRGYDVFLHYADFGMRSIKIRLPHGLPFPKKLWSKFVDGDFLRWKSDPKSKAGTLTLDPFHETLDSYWEFEDCLDDVIALRARLMAGDLRALYILWLCVAGDENFDPTETIEPPVPCGLQEFDLKLDGLFHFYEFDPLLIDVASDPSTTRGESQKNTVTPVVLSPAQRLEPWLKKLNANQAKGYLEQLLVGDTANVKAEILSEVVQSPSNTKQPDWPTVELNRTFEELLRLADDLREEHDAKAKKNEMAKAKREATKAQREREVRMGEMIKEPQKWLDETERLVNERGTANYTLAGEILADLKEAIGGLRGAEIARKHAAHLVRKHPTLSRLKGSLRKSGVLN